MLPLVLFKAHLIICRRTSILQRDLKSFHPRVSEMDASISEFGYIHCCKYRFQSKLNKRITNGVDPDETTRCMYELSYLDLNCLQRCVYWFEGLKG